MPLTKSSESEESWLSKNLVALALFALTIASVIGSVVYNSAMTNAGVVSVQRDVADLKLTCDRIDKLGPAFGQQMKVTVDAHTLAINDLKADGRIAQRDVAEIKAQISVLANKLDNLIELVKRGQQDHKDERNGVKQ